MVDVVPTEKNKRNSPIFIFFVCLIGTPKVPKAIAAIIALVHPQNLEQLSRIMVWLCVELIDIPE